MKIAGFTYQFFSIKFKSPFHNSSRAFSDRNGFIINLNDEKGNTAWGEASPLPGFSSEALEDVEKELELLSKKAIGIIINDFTSLKENRFDFNLSPSLKFAFEQAVFSLSLINDISLNEKLLAGVRPYVDVNAVISLEENTEVLNAMAEKIKNGYAAFKIKIGRNNFEEDLQLIRSIRNEFGNEIKLRFDANGKWALNEAKKNLAMLGKFNPEYVEEPCKGIDDLTALADISSVPVAIDESVKTIEDVYNILCQSNINFIVIKPMILGAFFEIFAIIKHAESFNKNIIISSSFESSAGRSGLALLSSMTRHNYAHGLDTGSLMINDLFADPFPVLNGKITFRREYYPPEFKCEII